MYILGLVLFAISFGLVGYGVFSSLVRSEKKKGRISIVAGTLLLIFTFVMYSYVPQVSGEERITADEVAVTEGDNERFVCTVTDNKLKTSYSSSPGSKEAAEETCKQFEVGKNYTITYEYDFDNDKYTITKLVGREN
ncbi:hypothetical protein FIU87_01315 [Bacillus sp. THAF10]|uniref:hypothetical protein n=1 Tax=Bacillus sp. THAF10 TaxID=2587848 RepID=UPI0012681991|nr:hypothetical protein [Bacillus sp. THAF10]QFT87291.1 hypothetical protein FIU87_01315 [Bacillus sp. THAF10]